MRGAGYPWGSWSLWRGLRGFGGYDDENVKLERIIPDIWDPVFHIQNEFGYR